MGANKPVAPASLLQVGGAGRVVGKKSLELWERLWEPKIATLVNVHEHGRTLPLVAVGDNRIGKELSSERLHLTGPRPPRVKKGSGRALYSLIVHFQTAFARLTRGSVESIKTILAIRALDGISPCCSGALIRTLFGGFAAAWLRHKGLDWAAELLVPNQDRQQNLSQPALEVGR